MNKYLKNVKMVKRGILLLLLSALLGLFVTVIVNSFNPNHVLSNSNAPEVFIPRGSYQNFLKIHQGIPEDALDEYPLDFNRLKDLKMPQNVKIVIDGTTADTFHADNFGIMEIVDEHGVKKGEALRTTSHGFATWTVPHVPKEGLYNVYINYYPLRPGSASIERAIYVNLENFDPNDPDKTYPFQYDDLQNIKFPRYWRDSGPIFQDTTGNDMRPSQVQITDVFLDGKLSESDIMRSGYIRDESGFVVEPYLIHLNEGENTITLESIRDSMAIVEIVIESYERKLTYDEYYEQYYTQGYREQAMPAPIKIQGQDSSERTAPTLHAIPDRTDPLNFPIHPVRIKLNAIGGVKWNTPGDAITWDIDLTDYESGFYQITFRAKQNVSRGLFSTRRVYINGEVPFVEAYSARFKYGGKYSMVTLGDDKEPFFFFLEGGKVNTITLESTLGDYGVRIGQVFDAINQLNDLYLRIISITTVNPDPYQDYHLVGENARVVGVLETFASAAEILETVSKEITEISGEKSDKVAILDTMAIQLRDMIAKPRTIQGRLTDFGRNISALGNWINDIKQQSLIVESIYVHNSEYTIPSANSSFFVSNWFNLRGFVSSFFFDYESIGIRGGIEGAREVEVWFLTSEAAGREQANSISTLITNSLNQFLEDDNREPINVRLKVVAGHVILPATLAGKGPDVAINLEEGLPVNYAMRNAVLDISGFPEFYEVTGICSAKNAEQGLCNYGQNYNQDRFEDMNEQWFFNRSALVPYEYGGGYYALPNTQSFLVMFYRNDIFDSRGWEVPETWREVTSLVKELSISNLQFFLPLSLSGATSHVNPVFASMLYQRGGSFYRNGNRESNFDSEEAMIAFEEWSKYYTDYSFPLAANFLNRFRTGETPIGIAGYEMFNTLSVFAPEISGKWSFAPLPGTIDSEGKLQNQGATSTSAVAMMRGTHDPAAAWDFMRWWVSKDTQALYAHELESILGAAARHNTANVLAFNELPWSRDEKRILISQWENSVGIPNVPGGYYTGRNLENAFRQVVNSRSNPRETLQEYIILINSEITKKRSEFGLD